MNAPFNPIASVIVQVIHSNQHLFYFFSEVNAFWNLYVLTDTGRLFRRQYSNTSQPLKSAHEKSWQSYATRFLGGVKDGLLYIPSPPSADKLVLKVFPEDPNPQFHELMNVGDASERSDILASLLRSVADDAQSKHATGKPLKSQTGGALAAEETSGVGDADLMAQLDEARRQRDYYKQLLDSNSAGPTPVVLSAGKAPKKRAAERSLLNPRQKIRPAKKPQFVSDDEDN
ncbi:hypothetical protein HK101_010599 [Irineochytrium annulatum]|nr:hypothetical protein HK101_010599 [Irineochytrium annulatum]